MSDAARPVCFIAMPFGKKRPPGSDGPKIDFDVVHSVIEQAVKDSQLTPIRADYERSGGFVHRAMYERLLVAEFVIADLSLANANVAYEVGVRHGAGAGRTILICGEDSLASLPFDFRPLRVIPYRLNKKGVLRPADKRRLQVALQERLVEAMRGARPDDNPIVQVTHLGSAGGGPDHQKTDAFLARMKYAGTIGERVRAAIDRPAAQTKDAIAELEAIESEILSERLVVAQLHTALISLLLGYREKAAYAQMVQLYLRLDHVPELQQTSVVREQVALAHNRIAEAHLKALELTDAEAERTKAIALLSPIIERAPSSETYGILGRIHKGHFDGLVDESPAPFSPALQAVLNAAIDAYQRGFRLDPRDYYPGVNEVTLRIRRATAEDEEVLSTLIPVVQFAANRAPAPGDDSERYWQTATKLELEAARRDWSKMSESLVALLGIPAKEWMRETTAKNLRIQRSARAAEPETCAKLDDALRELAP